MMQLNLDEQQSEMIWQAYLDAINNGLGKLTQFGELLTRGQLAQMLGVAPDTLTRHILDLPGFPRVLVGTQYRYPRTEVLKFISEKWTKA